MSKWIAVILIHYSVFQTELKKGNKHRGFEHSFEKSCYKQVRVHWGKSKCRVVVHSLSVSDSFQPHGLQHTWFPCPSLSPWVCSNSCPFSQLSNVEINRIKEIFFCFQMEGIGIDVHAERDDLVERRNWCRGERGNYWRDRLELTGGEAFKCKQNWWI